MKLIILGSGTCVPSLLRCAPGYYLEIGGKQIIVDCGAGTLRQLESTGKSYKDIDAVFLTHTHPDHVADLIPFIHALMATPGFEREKKLSIIGSEGMKQFYEKCVRTLLKMPTKFDVEVIEMLEKLNMGSCFVFSGSTLHSDNSIAYRFEEGGKAIIISGDCDYDEALVEFARDADLIVADCSFPDNQKVPGHMTSRECGLLAKNAGVKTLVLSHIYPAALPDEERVTECRAAFHGEIVLAEDLMEFDL